MLYTRLTACSPWPTRASRTSQAWKTVPKGCSCLWGYTASGCSSTCHPGAHRKAWMRVYKPRTPGVQTVIKWVLSLWWACSSTCHPDACCDVEIALHADEQVRSTRKNGHFKSPVFVVGQQELFSSKRASEGWICFACGFAITVRKVCKWSFHLCC